MAHKISLSSLVAVAVMLLALPALAEKVTEIPPNTTIRVRVSDSLSSAKAQVGDTFHGTLEEAIMVNGVQAYPKGADVTGRVTDVHTSGRLSEPGELDLVIGSIASGSRASSVESQPLIIKGEGHTKSNAEKIGGGAALGAIIGAIAGGGKGAAIGTVAGGAAGTAGAAATGKREAVVQPETVLSFTTVQASTMSSEAGSPRPTTSADDEAPELRRNKTISEPATSKTSEADQTQASGKTPAAQDDKGAPDQANSVPESGDRNPSDESTSDNLEYAFTARDRRVIRGCVAEHTADLPAGITQREDLPAGNERSVRAGGALPADIARKSQALPLACERQLAKLPNDVERVVYNGRVLLIRDRDNHILDMFYLDETQ
ncbi:MAG TPA: hypothetical protein VFA89_16645 [Terriglobales bacterium]|nr:hypothetical protein [Terriglobales bacterium]